MLVFLAVDLPDDFAVELFEEERWEVDFLEEDFFLAADAEAGAAGDFVCEAPHTPAIRIATKTSRVTAYGN